MTKYRVFIDMIENGYVDVEAENEVEAKEMAVDASNDGGFVGSNSRGEVVGIEINE